MLALQITIHPREGVDGIPTEGTFFIVGDPINVEEIVY